jgi:hypothetical protein
MDYRRGYVRYRVHYGADEQHYLGGVVQYWGACKLCKSRTFLGVTTNTCTKCKLGKSEPRQEKPDEVPQKEMLLK